MTLNQYVGEINAISDLDAFVKGVKEEAIRLRLPADNIKIKNKEGLLMVQCIGDVANIIRSRKEVLRFRCDKIGAETANDAKKDKE